jgi:thiamine biosynthesis protein ThiS
MKLQINGEAREFPLPLSLTALLEQMGLKADRVAVELNRNIVSRDQWSTTALNEGDQLEIVHFVGGGIGLSAASS